MLSEGPLLLRSLGTCFSGFSGRTSLLIFVHSPFPGLPNWAVGFSWPCPFPCPFFQNSHHSQLSHSSPWLPPPLSTVTPHTLGFSMNLPEPTGSGPPCVVSRVLAE